ncbi:MAG: hypothetical protein ACK5LL_05335 [Suipraeoptans sp.]
MQRRASRIILIVPLLMLCLCNVINADASQASYTISVEQLEDESGTSQAYGEVKTGVFDNEIIGLFLIGLLLLVLGKVYDVINKTGYLRVSYKN